MFCIWSIEHEAWWRHGAMGYSKDLKDAGIYNLDDTKQILKDANQHKNEPEEIAIPVTSLGVQHGLKD